MQLLRLRGTDRRLLSCRRAVHLASVDDCCQQRLAPSMHTLLCPSTLPYVHAPLHAPLHACSALIDPYAVASVCMAQVNMDTYQAAPANLSAMRSCLEWYEGHGCGPDKLAVGLLASEVYSHVHMHTCTCTRAHAHASSPARSTAMCTCTRAHAHVHMHTCTCTRAHAHASSPARSTAMCTCTCACTCTHMRPHACAHARTHTCIRTRTHTHARTRKHACAHTCMRA